MKAILKFNLDGTTAHLRCVKSLDITLTFWELLYNTKKGLLYNCSEEFEKGVEAVYSRLYETLENNDINIDKLIV